MLQIQGFIHLRFGAESPNFLKLLINDEKVSSRHHARFSNTVQTQLPRVLCELHGATSCGVKATPATDASHTHHAPLTIWTNVVW